MQNAHLATFSSHLQIVTYLSFQSKRVPCGSSQQGSYKLILHSRNPLRVILLTNMNSLCSQLGLNNMPIKEMLLLILLLTNIPQLGDSRYLPSSAIFG